MYESRIHQHCYNGREDDLVEVKRMFAEHGAQRLVLLRDEKWAKTPLHVVCSQNSIDIVKFLIEVIYSEEILNDDSITSQEIVNAVDEFGNTPLHCACSSNWPRVAMYLLTEPSLTEDIIPSLTMVNERDETVLHSAFRGETHIEVVNKLLSHPECPEFVNRQDRDGHTVLHIAAFKYTKFTILEHLLYCPHIDPTIKTCHHNPFKRKTALDLMKGVRPQYRRDRGLEHDLKVYMKEYAEAR